MYWLRNSVGSDLLSLTANRSRSVLAVKGSRRRFAPWTAAGRSEGEAVYEGKGRYQPVILYLTRSYLISFDIHG